MYLYILLISFPNVFKFFILFLMYQNISIKIENLLVLFNLHRTENLTH